MQRTLLFILSLTMLVSLPSAALAAQKAAPLTAEQVLDRHVAALGGREALSKVTSIVMKGRLEIPNQNLKGTVVSYASGSLATVPITIGMAPASGLVPGNDHAKVVLGPGTKWEPQGSRDALRLLCHGSPLNLGSCKQCDMRNLSWRSL